MNAADTKRFQADLSLQARAWEYAHKKNPKLPDPESILPLLRPMVFKKKKYGDYVIEGETNNFFNVTNERMSVLLGVKLLRVNFDTPATFNKLTKNGSVLTSDKPIEIYQQYCSFLHMRGRVLVGGLGLGMAASMILDNPDVKEVFVVEKSKTIIDLIHPQINRKIKVLNADLFEFMENKLAAGRFDSAYFDIWYGTGEQDWGRCVLPLYRTARRKGIKVLGAWGEFEMNWQLRSSLHRAAFLDAENSWPPFVVWRTGLRDYFKTELPCPVTALKEVEGLLELYLTGIGTPKWEKVFGLAADAALPK